MAKTLTEADKIEIGKRYVAGASKTQLTREFEVSYNTINRVLDHLQVNKDSKNPTNDDLVEFEKRASTILQRQDGKEKLTYNAWCARIAILQSPEGKSMTREQAIVSASKEREFECVHRLFKEYDVTKYDLFPDSNPLVPRFRSKESLFLETACEHRELSYRENLRWAIEAAGKFLRSGIEPNVCPNDSSYFLYKQAVKEPKDFMSKLGQVESKLDNDDNDKANRKAAKKTIEEIDKILYELTSED